MGKKAFIPLIIILVLVSIALCVYNYCIKGNLLTALSGVLSAASTIGIGIIAYLQNRSYQRRADEQMDLALMPDIYISNSPLERYSSVTHAQFNTVKATLKDKTISTKNISIDFWFIKGLL